VRASQNGPCPADRVSPTDLTDQADLTDPMPSLPDGFSSHEIEHGRAVLRDDLAEALLAAGVADPDALTTGDQVRGRVSHPIVELGGEQGRVVVRRCARGGLLGKLMGRLFWGESRGLIELRVSSEARKRGAPVPEVVGGVVHHRAAGLCRLFVLTKEIPDAIDLRELIESSVTLSPSQRRDVLRSSAEAVAACHNAGLYHADLHVKNILIQSPQGAGPRAHVIDLDKATIHDSLTLRQRLSNLARLNRSVEKWPTTRESVSVRDKLGFFVTYRRQSQVIGKDAAAQCGRVSFHHRLSWRVGKRA